MAVPSRERQLVDGVWQYRTVEEGGNGGSQPVQLLDAGECMATDLLTNGPRDLYTPEVGDFVIITFSADDFEDLDHGFVWWGQNPSKDNYIAQQYATASGVAQQLGDMFGFTSNILPFQGDERSSALAICTTTDVFQAAVAIGDDPGLAQVLDRAAGTWQANHLYADGDLVVDSNGNVQKITTAGTSGGSEPTWDTTPGNTTNDNTAVWTNLGAAPTTGCVHVWLLVISKTGNVP